MYVLCKNGLPHDSPRETMKEAETDLKRSYSSYSRAERVVSMTDIKDNMFGIECAGGRNTPFQFMKFKTLKQ